MKQSKSDPRLSSQLWNSVNVIIGRQKTRDSGISSTVSPDSLTEFFCNVAVSEAHQTAEKFQSPSTTPPSEPFKSYTISSDFVCCILQHLDICKSVGLMVSQHIC